MTVLGWIIIILGALGSFVLGAEFADRYSDFNAFAFSCGLVSSVVLGSLFIGLGKIIDLLSENKENAREIINTLKENAAHNEKQNSPGDNNTEKILHVLTENSEAIKEIYNSIRTDAEHKANSAPDYSSSVEKILVLLNENRENTGKIVDSISLLQERIGQSDHMLSADGNDYSEAASLPEESRNNTSEIPDNQEKPVITEEKTASAEDADFSAEPEPDLFADLGEFLDDDFQFEKTAPPDEEKETPSEDLKDEIRYGINPKGQKAVYLLPSYMKDMGACPICNAIQRLDRHICYNCKTPLMYEEEPEEGRQLSGDIPIRTKVCPECGTMNGKNRLFCVMCGEKLD